MAKKKIIQASYIKDGTILYIHNKFKYNISMQEICNYGINLCGTKEVTIDEFKGFQIDKYVKDDKRRFLQTIELIGAPLSFLLENNFKLINNG